MTTVKSFNGWVMSKIMSYLSAKEGMQTEIAHYTGDGMRCIIQDSMGFRYEIIVKTIGRIHQPDELDQFSDLCNF